MSGSPKPRGQTAVDAQDHVFGTPPRWDEQQARQRPESRSTHSNTISPARTGRRTWQEEPVMHVDKVNSLLTSTSALEWGVELTIHQPGQLPLMEFSSRITPKLAKLVMTELKSRLPSSSSIASPTLAQVLLSGMTFLGALDLGDVPKHPSAAADAKSQALSWENIVEVVCHTEFKTHTAFRTRGPVAALEAHALASGLRRLHNLQKAASSPLDPVSSSLAAVITSGLLQWDRDAQDESSYAEGS